MNKKVLTIITAGILIAFGVIFYSGGQKSALVNNVQVKEGVQYVTINAKGGYFPAVSVAQAGIPTKLIVQTNGTYDCSAALVVRDANFRQMLPQNGATEIDLGVKNAGEKVEGVCGMGMYNFEVTFKAP
jgi:plastocyanin domain-containing protein